MDCSTPGLPALHHLPEFAQVQCSLKSTPDVKLYQLLYQKLYQLTGELWIVCFKMVNYRYYIDFTSLKKKTVRNKTGNGAGQRELLTSPKCPKLGLEELETPSFLAERREGPECLWWGTAWVMAEQVWWDVQGEGRGQVGGLPASLSSWPGSHAGPDGEVAQPDSIFSPSAHYQHLSHICRNVCLLCNYCPNSDQVTPSPGTVRVHFSLLGGEVNPARTGRSPGKPAPPVPHLEPPSGTSKLHAHP